MTRPLRRRAANSNSRTHLCYDDCRRHVTREKASYARPPLECGILLVLFVSVFQTDAHSEAYKNIAPETVAGCVILLHGLARTSASMKPMATALSAAGYRVVNKDYPSRQETIESLVDTAIPDALSHCEEMQEVHFVTHSLGGIMVRQYLSRNDIPNLGRVVMLSPPNQGSEVVDKLNEVPGYTLITGPAGQQLGTDKLSLPRSLGPARFEVGVITGSSTVNPILSLLIPGVDDGKVSIESAKIEGMADFLVVDHSHPFIMSADIVICQTLYFLRRGQFDRSGESCKMPGGPNPSDAGGR